MDRTLYGLFIQDKAIRKELSAYIRCLLVALQQPEVTVSTYYDIVLGRIIVYLHKGSRHASFELGPYDLEALDSHYMFLAIGYTLEKLDKEEINDVRGIEG